jgi:riboflavin transporter FmnP
MKETINRFDDSPFAAQWGFLFVRAPRYGEEREDEMGMDFRGTEKIGAEGRGTVDAAKESKPDVARGSGGTGSAGPGRMDATIESHSTAKLAKMGMMLAIAVVCSFVHFPLIPSVTFIEYELSDLPLLIACLAFGTVPGIILVACCVLLDAVIAGAGGGPQGMIMQFIAIGTYTVVVSLIYHRNKTRKSALIGLICGVLVMTAIMIPANLIVTPTYGIPLETVKEYIVPAIIPVNLLKGAISAAAVLFIYKRISPFLHR